MATAGASAEMVAGALQLSLQGLCLAPEAECPCAPLVLVFALISGPLSREGVVLVTFASMRRTEYAALGCSQSQNRPLPSEPSQAAHSCLLFLVLWAEVFGS